MSLNPLATQHILINSTRIAYGVYGTGEPVVLIHGTPSSSLIFRNILPHLLAANYRVHLFDLLGYGLSERPWDPSIDTSISAQVPILEGLLAHWGLSSAHIVAHDIGGGIAQRFAIFSPDRVRSLTLIDVVSFDSYPSARTKTQMANGLKAPTEEHDAHFREWLLSTVYAPEKLTGEVLETYMAYISGPVGQGSFFQHQMRQYDPKHTMEIAERVGELGVLPVKLIWGKDDAWQVVDWARKLNRAILRSELDVVEDCGHFSLDDQPERVAGILVEFLGRQTK
ncbi:alpha/beta hydrolase fold protein [Mytilinidion resinicola]|uniref:Alpha/beta hydrolase fold protein n=1 Tax=Mytilinidion resinicola TaxID=574789 RepID=A0A6A6Y9R8_9PEZI|nr:alpha/beta hydrolase fold protein [Mytilinidion resinicola]KAF2805440.1 alpha/beta hydrolase fold protein [Mytilinidion resinicola]